MKTRLVFLALLLFVTWVSSSQMNRLIGGNTPSLIAKSTSGGSELPSGDEKGLKHKQPVNTVYYLKFGEDKFDIDCHSEWILQKERSLCNTCQLADW